MIDEGAIDSTSHDAVSDEPHRVKMLTQLVFGEQGIQYGVRDNGHSNISLNMGAEAADDAAVFDFQGSGQLVASSDYIRGVGFSMYELGLMSKYDLGYYLVAANVSDIASMGARQIGFLSVVRYPKDLTDGDFLTIFHGIRDACVDFRTANVGGDVGTADQIILSGSALGVCPPGSALSRSGARVGDQVILSKPTGLAGAARDFYRMTRGSDEGLNEKTSRRVVESWSRPQPEVALGQYLGENRLATSCQDTSDGLKAALEQISDASGVALTIYEDQVPVDPAILEIAPHLGRDAIEIVFTDSVDFALVFTADAESVATIRDSGREVHVIGEVTSGSGSYLVSRGGETRHLPGKAWRHS